MGELEYIPEPSRQIPVYKKVDVVVVGGGPAGLSAAVTAARLGLETILVERYGCFGGNITVCAVEPPSWYRMPKTVESKTVLSELEARCTELGYSQPCEHNPPGVAMCHEADYFKMVCDEMVEKSQVEPLLHCMGAFPIMEGNEVKGIFTESKSGRWAILAKVVIDCTGDGDIAARAGAPYDKGGSIDHKLMGMTLIFGASGVDAKIFRDYITNFAEQTANPYTLEGLWMPFKEAIDNGEMPGVRRMDVKFNAISDSGDATGLNVAGIWDGKLDSTNVVDLTYAEMKLRKRVMDILDILKKHQPGFEKARLRTFAMQVGCRESRRIRGRYTISPFDIMHQSRFEDSIGIFPVHADGFGSIIVPDTDAYFEVPYGIILPEGVENLLVAGRCISGTHAAVATTREMNFCSITGQGAAAAAAAALRDGVSVRNVNPEKVQRELVKLDIRVH